MNLRAPTPVEPPLPWMAGTLQHRSPADGFLHLDPAAVASFNALLHELHPDAEQVDGDRLDQLASWLSGLDLTQARDILHQRLARIEQLRRMLDDDDWDASEQARACLAKLFAYLDDDQDLIPDQTPVIGLLDDVLLLELAWPAFVDEADDYADYCSFRDDERPAGAPEHKRHAWIETRLYELALLQQRHSVRDHRYVAIAQVMPFRIGS